MNGVVEGIWRGNTFVPGWQRTGPHKFPELDEVMLARKGTLSLSLQPRSYCVVKCHMLQEVTLLMQNSTGLDRKVDKYCWWRAAVAASSHHWFWCLYLYVVFSIYFGLHWHFALFHCTLVLLVVIP